MSKVDLELKKAFTELQMKAVETSQKLKLADLQIEQLKKNKKRAALTDQEISTIDPSCKMYETIGRMFMLQPKEQIIADLKKQQDTAEEKIKGLENSKAFLERGMKDAENNLREMVQQRK